MEDKVNDIDKRLTRLENLHIVASAIIVFGVAIYFISRGSKPAIVS